MNEANQKWAIDFLYMGKIENLSKSTQINIISYNVQKEY